MAPSGKQQVVQVTSTDPQDDFSHLSVIEADIPSPADGEVRCSTTFLSACACRCACTKASQ